MIACRARVGQESSKLNENTGGKSQSLGAGGGKFPLQPEAGSITRDID
jgi:hypothetical protein